MGIEVNQPHWLTDMLANFAQNRKCDRVVAAYGDKTFAESEAAIFANLEHAYRERTVIFISHRFSTVRNADRILVLAGGRIIEDGTHAYLMGREGLYARMYRTQAKGYLDRSPATALPADRDQACKADRRDAASL